MSSLTLSRYFAGRFFIAVTGVFVGIFVLVEFVDYIDLMRKAADVPNAPPGQLVLMSFYRVPQIMERLLPFSVLIGAMVCFFGLSRRMELVVARGAGMSVWQIIAPSLLVALLLGALGTLVYNRDNGLGGGDARLGGIEAQIFGQNQSLVEGVGGGYWVRQRGTVGESILNALQSREQGLRLSYVTAFTFTAAGAFNERIEAQDAELTPGAWLLSNARVYAPNAQAQDFETYTLPTKLTREQVAESFAARDTVGFWHSAETYIRYAEDLVSRLPAIACNMIFCWRDRSCLPP